MSTSLVFVSLCLTRVAHNSPRLINLWPSDPKSNWNLEMLVFEERGKPEYPEKNLSEQGREPTTNSTHMMPSPGIELGRHWWEACVGGSTTVPSLLPQTLSLSYTVLCKSNASEMREFRSLFESSSENSLEQRAIFLRIFFEFSLADTRNFAWNRTVVRQRSCKVLHANE